MPKNESKIASGKAISSQRGPGHSPGEQEVLWQKALRSCWICMCMWVSYKARNDMWRPSSCNTSQLPRYLSYLWFIIVRTDTAESLLVTASVRVLETFGCRTFVAMEPKPA